jgi:hypothetical protein
VAGLRHLENDDKERGMKVLTLAAGFAVGYVLGTKAGREKYEQIATTARKVSSHPMVVLAEETAKSHLRTAGEAATAKLKAVTGDAQSGPPDTAPSPRRTSTVVPPVVNGDPLA